jgi:predicted  nucleic acid-binding Zn-ribbon protein
MSDVDDDQGEAAPPGPLELLLAIQDEDTTIDQLEHRRDHLPERAAVDTHAGTVAGVEAEQAAQDERRTELDRNLKRLQDEVASLEARIAEVTRTLHSGAVTAPRELQALQHEQESLRRRQDHLETEELELMEELDPLNETLAALNARLEELSAEGERLDQALIEAEVHIEEELTSVTARRAEAAAGVDAGLITTYEELRKRLGGIAVARLVRSVCGGCHLGLSAAEVDRIKKQPPDALVTCDECGRLLVR